MQSCFKNCLDCKYCDRDAELSHYVCTHYKVEADIEIVKGTYYRRMIKDKLIQGEKYHQGRPVLSAVEYTDKSTGLRKQTLECFSPCWCPLDRA